MSWEIIQGDCLEALRAMPEGSVQTVVTSPPYWGLRDYQTGAWEGGDPNCDHRKPTEHQKQGATSLRAGRSNVEEQRNENFRAVCGRCGARRADRQLGLEATPDEYVASLVAVFREVRRVLRDDGTVWLNLGDSYASSPPGNKGEGLERYRSSGLHGAVTSERYAATLDRSVSQKRNTVVGGLKPKDLCGIPWRVAFALQADGWWLRLDIIWSKPNPMPESVTDRPTRAHEYVFLLSKSARYFYDADAIREAHQTADRSGDRRSYAAGSASSMRNGEHQKMRGSFAGLPLNEAGRNRRSVWEIATQPYPGAHFATFPAKLVEPCILAGSSPKACGECGAPWKRIIGPRAEQGNHAPSGGPKAVASQEVRESGGIGRLDGGRRSAEASTFNNNPARRPPPPRTVGWRPSCSHAYGLDMSRPQARRAAELFERSGLTEEHLAAVRSVGLSDAGKAAITQSGTGRNTERVIGLADEAKRVLGGYFREFARPPTRPSALGPGCRHEAGVGRCVVLDPFAGSGTVGVVCGWHGRDFIGIELNPDYCEMARRRIQREGRPGGPLSRGAVGRIPGADQLTLLGDPE